MGSVAAKIKVMPKNTDVDLEELTKSLKEVSSSKTSSADIKNIKKEDIAFGLKALIVTVVVPDDEGGTENIEDAFKELKNVESVRVEDINRLM